MKNNKRFTYNNIQFEATVTFYLECLECQEELECHVPEKIKHKNQEFTVTVVPHNCNGGEDSEI